MTLHVHHLTGCAPTPLAHYLKALGILRVVAEQRDPEVLGWWQDEHFCLMTKLSDSEIEEFFLESYAPTPMFNPWGARSGFYSGSSERTARVALEKIEGASLPRLAAFRNAIGNIRHIVTEQGGTKPKTEDGQGSLIGRLRREVRDGGDKWLSAVTVLVGNRYCKPALLGTGGSEGSESYLSGYLNAIVACIIDRSEDGSLYVSSSKTHAPKYSWDGAFGQFLPNGDASAWDYLLMLEGAVLFRSTVAQRSRSSHTSSARFLASPFYLEPCAAGAASSAQLDEFCLQKGTRMPGRGEQWFPIWTAPTRLPEVETMLSEGRCSVGRRHASRSIDAAHALGRLGVARGISAFYRYGYLQRNNLATHFAVPLARLGVRERPKARLVDDLSPWLDALKRVARDKNSPARARDAERRLADAVFAVLTHDDTPDRWQAVLLAASAVESIQAGGTAVKAGPIPGLAPEWLLAADDGSVEWRLARALGSAAAAYETGRRPRDPVRHHWLPLQPGGWRFLEKDGRLARDARVVMTGRDAVADCGALLERRLIDAAQRGQRQLRLMAARGCEANPSDLAELIAGRVDLDRVSALARSLMALRWERPLPRLQRAPHGTSWPEEAWMALRLACLPWPLADGQQIPVDSAMVRRLLAGDGGGAVDLALRRLRAAGLRPPLRAACADPTTSRLWAAALAFPISQRSARRMAQHFEFTSQKENR